MELKDHPLRLRTSFRIGGPAARFVEPESEEELRAALMSSADRGEPARALGGGRNLLVDDRGVRGLVVAFTRLKGLEFRGTTVLAAAGTSLAALLRQSVVRGLKGLEGLAGVPGTVGGAVRMNAGGALGAIGSSVRWVRGLDRNGESFRFDRDACGFAYRTSNLGGLFVTQVCLDLEAAQGDVSARVEEVYRRKRASQPLSAASAGCTFKNPDLPGGESAGLLLDRVGLKGMRRGEAEFSVLHANFIVNLGGARCTDVEWLIREGRRRVYDRYGVDLALEVEVWRRGDNRTPAPAGTRT